MAKEKVSKSQAVRDYLAKNTSAGPTEVVEALGKIGIKVTASLVSQVKYQKSTKKKTKKKVVKKKRVKKRAGKKKAGKATKKRVKRRGKRKAAQSAGYSSAAINFIEACGGLKQAKKELDQLEALKDIL